MSWSVTAMGKGKAVGAKLAVEFAGLHKMNEPEHAIKDKVAEIVALATDAAPDAGFIVRANGSQWSAPGHTNINLKVEIDTVVFSE
jgi:hypothetical protein